MKIFGKSAANAQKGDMARQIVYFCLRFLAGMTVWAMAIVTLAVILDRMTDLTALGVIYGSACGVFGGELVLLMIKRLFAKDKPSEEINEEGDY